MNPVEIEEAVSNLALEPFDQAEFPFQFLRAFGQKDTALARLRAGNTNQSDVPGAILQRGNIHIATCDPGAVDETLRALRESPKTTSQKAKFILATDGEAFQAEDMNGGGTVSLEWRGGMLATAELHATQELARRVRYRNAEAEIRLTTGGRLVLRPEDFSQAAG
ncbi:type IIL restriction-modification enzyme MmeI [Altererythrobacter lauratis]|uniref:Type IIL restriction-modification enzyme MmeI n=1 Tax=Alteraurantiacibacter lauratis TaxID=2054627 RepID=A0ABV7EGB6_9SPHN